MNKEDIINTLTNNHLDSDKYVVISGAAMVLYGIKEKTGDIDISVSADYYDYLLKNYDCTFERINEFGEKVYFIDNVINFGNTYYSDNKNIIENIPVQTIDELNKLKKY